MTSDAEGVIEVLRDAILRYGDLHPERVRRFTRGERVIQEGAVSDVCFLIRSGTVSILVNDAAAASEREVALRYKGELIGETAFLQRGVPRTASVVVFSPEAELVSITRPDLYELLTQEPTLQDAIASLWELSASRRRETLAVLGGKISVQTKMMSALLADIHNFSGLSEVVWEEETDAFLFDFVEFSSDTAQRRGGVLEDQGDGFKILFSERDHASRATLCALEISGAFRQLRGAWASTNAAFRKIGLGVGVCTDFMSVRRRDDSARTEGRVLSHALNVAAAISKYREAVDETEVYVDETTRRLVREQLIGFKGAEEIPLEKIGRRQTVYRAFKLEAGTALPKTTPLPQQMPTERTFISYSHADSDFVDRLVRRLELDGVAVWRDSTHILVGDDIDRTISQGIQDNQLFLIVLTHDSVRSDWVSREFDEASHEAVSGGKVLLPVLAKGLRTADLPPRIRRKKSVTFENDFETPYSILLNSIRAHTRRSAAKFSGSDETGSE